MTRTNREVYLIFCSPLTATLHGFEMPLQRTAQALRKLLESSSNDLGCSWPLGCHWDALRMSITPIVPLLPMCFWAGIFDITLSQNVFGVGIFDVPLLAMCFWGWCLRCPITPNVFLGWCLLTYYCRQIQVQQSTHITRRSYTARWVKSWLFLSEQPTRADQIT